MLGLSAKAAVMLGAILIVSGPTVVTPIPHELAFTPDGPPGEMDQWISDLGAAHRTFAERLTDRQSQTIPSGDPDSGDLGRAFPAWTSPGKNAILQPPKPEIPPSPRVLQRAMDRDAGWVILSRAVPAGSGRCRFRA